jgi:nucleoside-diphosphate-sugar epimerase
MATAPDDDGSTKKVTIVFGSSGVLGSACMRRLTAENRWAIGVSSTRIFSSEGPSAAASVSSGSGLKSLWGMIGAAHVEALLLLASAGPDSAPAKSHYKVNQAYEAFLDTLELGQNYPRSIVFASSSLLNTTPEVGSQGPGAPSQQTSDYLASKLSFEEFLQALAEKYRTSSITSLRLGPIVSSDVSADRGNLVGDIVRALQHGTVLSVRGNGRAMRGFLHLDDAVSAVFTASKLRQPGFQVRLAEGSPQVSVHDFVTKVSEITGVRVNHSSQNPPTFTSQVITPKVGGDRTLEDWGPRISMEEMIIDVFGGIRSSTDKKK